MNHVNAYYVTARELKQDRKFELASILSHESSSSKVQFFFLKIIFQRHINGTYGQFFLLFTRILDVSGHALIFLTDSVFFLSCIAGAGKKFERKKEWGTRGRKKRKKLDLTET